MNIRIPVYTAMQERKERDITEHYARIERDRQEKSLFDMQIKQQKQSIENGQALSKSIQEISKQSKMTLNQELYSGTSGYQNPSTFSNHVQNKRIANIAYWQSPSAQAMIGRFVDTVHGPFLGMQSMPMWSLITGAPNQKDSDGKLSKETIRKRSDIVKNIELRWKLYAKSTNSDSAKKLNFHKRSRERFFDLMFAGEYIEVLRYSKSKKRNSLTIQNIPPEDLQQSGSVEADGNTVVDGIEYNKDGAPVAYHIMNHNTGNSVRVPKFQPKTGRQTVIHNTLGRGHRGEPLLNGIISDLTKLSDFQALEIQAAVINALFAVWVETAIGGTPEKMSIAKAGGVTAVNCSNIEQDIYDTSSYNAQLKSVGVDAGGIVAQPGIGQKLQSFDTKRPTANFKQFYDTIITNLASAKGMPRSVLLYDFQKSYSAARGELLVFWERVLTMRYDHVMEYSNIIYKSWMWGEIDNGNIPRYKWYSDELVRDAMSEAKWTGPGRPDIDPEKSAKAHEIESKYAWKTDQQITAERSGGDHDENIERKVSENEARANANEPIVRQENTSYSENKSESKTESKTIEPPAEKKEPETEEV